MTDVVTGPFGSVRQRLGAGRRPGVFRDALLDVGVRSYTRTMTTTLADYVEAGYALTPDQRLEAARMLRLSVEQDTQSDQPEIDAAWDEVIARRVAEIAGGAVELVDGPASITQIRTELAQRRS